MTDRRHLNAMERAVNRAISRREILRIGGVVIPAAVLLPAWMTTANAQSATTFDFYISTSGSDSNPGTLASPWAITSLISTSGNNSKIAGKRVGFLPGTYNVAGVSGVAGATKIGNGSYPTNGSFCALSIPPGSSSASTYIGSSDSSGNYSPRTATIVLQAGQNGSGNNQWYNAIIGRDQTSTAGYVTIDGLVINGKGANGGMDCAGADGNEGAHICFFQSTDGSFTSAGSMAACVVQNCEISGIASTDNGGNDAGIWFQGCTGGIAQNNYLHDISKQQSDASHCHAIEAYGCTNLKWIYNTITNCSGGALEPKEGCSNITAAYNYIYNCATSGVGNSAVFQAWDGAEGNPNSPNTPFYIHHNIVDSCGRVSFGESNNAGHSMQVQWYNNTIFNSGEVILNSIDGAVMMHYNNLYVLTSGGNSSQVALSSGGVSPLAYDCFYNVAAGSYSGIIAGATEATGLLTGSDPKFTAGTASIAAGGGAAQFQLASGSPCAGAGRAGGSSSGAAVNIGAWDGTVTQIGCNFTTGSSGTANPVPSAPSLSVS